MNLSSRHEGLLLRDLESLQRLLDRAQNSNNPEYIRDRLVTLRERAERALQSLEEGIAAERGLLDSLMADRMAELREQEVLDQANHL